MAGARAIKSRIKSTKNIQQITKAMQAVSAVKMRKSEAIAISGRLYALYALNILKKIEKNTETDIKNLSPLFDSKINSKSECLVVISSDKGLAGAFNSNVIKKSEKLIASSNQKVDIVAVGKKGRDYFARKGLTIAKGFEGVGDLGTLAEAKEISDFVINLFIEKKYSKIDIVYTNFISALKQEVVVRPLLPLHKETLEQVVANIIPESGKYSELKASFKDDALYSFESSPEEIIHELVPKLVELEVYHSILEANASEHSARMLAMKNASENAKDMISSLTIKYNKERQAQITKELIEITSGKNALEASNE
ncbi:MAG: synthase, gamma subunit [Candidatus Taylorbacteria bacterium]|nr:synthase, gamma subunit [Candidatus Taylorbacteria bacterium]